jgi:hypothetical protein
MALKVTEEQLTRWKQQAQSMKDKISKYREKADLIVERAVQTVEIGASAFGMGVLMGKVKDHEVSVLGVPVDLGVGLGLNLLGYLGVGGKYVDHLHNLGNGSLAHYLGKVGFKVGEKWQSGGGGKQLGSSTKGELASGQTGAGVTDADLAALIHATR